PNSVPKYDGGGNFTPSNLMDLQGTLLYTSASTAELELGGGQSVARFGEDLRGAFISSDTPRNAVRWLTRPIDGQLTEWARLTGTGILSVTPDVAANGEIATGPDSLDRIRDYDGQAGDQVHFRLSRGACDPSAVPLAPGCDLSNPYAQDFTIAPYS